MRGVEREVRAPVLEQHARAPRHHARAEQSVDALDERGGVALGVHRADEDRVAGEAARGGHAVPRQRAGRIHERAALVGVRLRHEPRHRHLDELRIGDQPVAVVEGDLLRLDEEMYEVGT